MENKNQNSIPTEGSNDDVHTPPSAFVAPQSSQLNASSLEQPIDSHLTTLLDKPGKNQHFFHSKQARIIFVLLLLFICAAAILVATTRTSVRNNDTTALQRQVANRFNTIELPLNELLSGKETFLAGTANVTINGTLQIGNGLSLTPSLQPTGAKPGQIYYDQGTNQLAYYNGSNFVFLTSGQVGGVQSLGGATGQLVLGEGLTVNGDQVSNGGVLTVQGTSGDISFTAGPGIILNGTTFSNSGVISVTAGTPNVTISNNGGEVTISVETPLAGTGTVTSGGGTSGKVPVYTAAQNIEDSIISQSGLNITVTGNLDVVSGNLSLASALTVGNGGTGASSLTNNGVLVGQGAAAVTAVTAGGAGLCLLSTGGLPSWSACPGGGGVTTLNGLNGALNLANASAAGSTVTIDDASTTTKGIASFNATNFSVSSGAVNTIQNINSGATPTFAGINTNSITPNAALTVGIVGHSLTLQGNATTTLTATNGANTTALAFVTPTANVTYRLQTASTGTYDICTSAGNCSSGTVSSPGGTTNRLAKFTGAQVIGDSIIVDNGSNVDVGGTLSVQGNTTLTGDVAVNGGDITSSGVLSITPGGTLTIGVAGQQLTLQGNASTSLATTNGANTTSLTFQAPTANVTYRLPTAAAGTYDLCTTVGNCVGSGGGVTTSGGTTNRLAKFSGSQTIDNSTLSDDGTNVTTSVDLIIQGGDITVGVANAQTGSMRLAHSGSTFVGTVLQGALTANRTYTLPDADGTICLTSGNCSGAGSPNTLQAAYDAGNTITTTTARDIAIALADSATDASFTITAATGSTGYVGIVRADGGGTTDPAQLLLVDNLDTDRAQPVGLKIQSAGGGITTALDLTDAEIGTAINVAANDILGTTGNIDLTHFDVTGSTGNIVTAGTLNGQTISSTASFTGTVAVAGNMTLTSDLAVNGGDLSSTGALNITPGGTLTVGVTSQQLILQGNAGTQLTATGGGFTTTVGFGGTPTGAVTYAFDRAAAAGTYTICTTIGNCAGSGGGVTTSGGTTGTVAKFTGSQTLGDSLLAESGGTVTVNGNLNLVSGNQFQVNGTQISSANLSNDANLAKLSSSQTFTGNTVAFQNGTNSANAFNVQNAAGNRILTIDSSSASVILGTASTLDGKLVFHNVSNGNTATILPGTPSANRTLTLPDESGTVCLQSSTNCGFALSSGSGNYIQNQNSISQTANFRITGTGRADTALQAPALDTPTAAALAIGQTNATGITLYQNTSFASGKTVTIQGNTAINPAADSTTVLNVKTSLGNNMFTVDTTNGRVGIGLGSSNVPTLQSTGLEMKGAIRLSGANSSYSDRYLTPSLGSPVDSLINVVNYNPNINGQILAMGLPSTADTTTRVISLFDARSGTHQPTLAIFSPGEGAIGGFSWDGSNTDFSVKNTVAGAIKLNINGTDRVIATATGIGINTTPSYAVDAAGDANVTGVYRINGTPICASTGCTASTTSAILNQHASTQSARFKIQGPDANTNTGTVVAFSGQNNDLLQFQSAVGAPLAGIRPSGAIYSAAVTDPITDVPANARLFVQPVTNSHTAIVARAASGGAPTGDIMQLQNAGGTVNVFSVGVSGATTITNSSTAALNVQNASNASVFNVNTSTTVITMAGGNNGALPAFTAAANTPAAREAHATVTVNGYLYVLGGCDSGSSATGNVQFARVRNDGSVGAWAGTTSLPQANCNGAATTYNGYIFFSGGTGSAALSNDVYVGKVNADGSISSWQTLTDVLPKDLRMHNMQAANGYLYVFGGKQENFTINRDLYYFPINADGTLGSATTSSNFLAAAGQAVPCSVIANGYLYIIGGDGSGSAVVTYSLLNVLTGAPGAASTTTAMGLYRSDCSAVVSSGYLYVMGSLDSGGVTAHSEIYQAQLNANVGTISAWTQNTTSLLGNRSNAGAVVINGYIYFVAGWDGATAQDNVWYTSPARVVIGGNLDLLATNTGANGTTDGGGTGGNLTAGNTLVSGTLTVTGATQIRDSINIGNNLSVGGQASFKNATNAAAAFQVLNSSSVPQFVIDTSNARIYVGNPTADSTGALLILDTKNTSGDPTGVNGGMYYNSSLGKMRCYEQGYWRDCSPSARTGFYYTNDMTTISPDSVTIRDASGTGADNDGSVVSGVAQHPGIVQQQTGTTATGVAYFGSGDALGTSILLGNGDTWRYESSVRIPTLSTGTQRFSYRVGFIDGGLSDTDGTDGCFMKYNDNVNGGRWQGVCISNTTASTCDTGITVGANTWYRLTVLVNSAGNSADFQTDGVSRCQVTNNIPTASGRQTAFQNTLAKSIGTTERVVDLDYLDIQGFFSR